MLGLFLLAGCLVPAWGHGQDCIGAAPQAIPGWVVAEAAGTVALPLPLAGTLDVGPASPGVALAAGMQFRNGFVAKLGFEYFSLLQNQSFIEYVRFTDLSLQGGYTLWMQRSFQWELGLKLGLSFAGKRFFQPKLDETGALKPKPDSKSGYLYEGGLFETSVVAPVVGLSTRVTWFPLPWLGAYAELAGVMVLHGELRFEDGTVTLRPQFGAQVHF
jgi:hypothetical protein